MLKTDKRDALGLANHLYSQLELGVQVPDKLQAVRRLAPPTEAAAQLKGMVRHRYELIAESTQRKNKLIAICDEIFPELTQVRKDLITNRDQLVFALCTFSNQLVSKSNHSFELSSRLCWRSQTTYCLQFVGDLDTQFKLTV